MAQYPSEELDRLVDLVTERVRAQLSSSSSQEAAARDHCADTGGSSRGCPSHGASVACRPWPVRAVEAANASRSGAPADAGPGDADLARLIDHTLLKPEATREDIVRLCGEASHHRFASVCVSTTWVPMARTLLEGSGVMVCAVVGFPLGAMTPSAKAYEAREAARQGAREIDMVINIGALKSRDYETVLEDICHVVKAAAPAGVKVILETGALTQDEKIIACALSKAAGAAFVKTSTGFGKGGATVEDVALMRRIVGPDMGVKASGGVRTAEDARRMTAAGASRIGASASVAIAAGSSPAAGAQSAAPPDNNPPDGSSGY